jgi:hypothetical protein
MCRNLKNVASSTASSTVKQNPLLRSQRHGVPYPQGNKNIRCPWELDAVHARTNAAELQSRTEDDVREGK